MGYNSRAFDITAEHLSDFSLRMKLSGYDQGYRHNIICSALVGWEKQKEKDMNGTKPMFRDKNWNKMERKKEKERKSAHWFRMSKDNNYDFPIFCPCTPGSDLAKRWKKGS